jgi:hypothetical protein
MYKRMNRPREAGLVNGLVNPNEIPGGLNSEPLLGFLQRSSVDPIKRQATDRSLIVIHEDTVALFTVVSQKFE